ncbi:hypothetical protein [Geofilum rhodophaeum]|uniref:hypothetical protein n=1 Tax=Geofilum rhodophaeum TaxID=1965019 RepID=UPI0011BAC28E|nr:hypothetical protein [Geofilum rhodophaeum]
MTTKSNPSEDLKHIRQMMEASSKFLSLSGLSGIAVGSFALAGAAIAYFIILKGGTVKYNEFIQVVNYGQNDHLRSGMLLNALFVLSGALLSSWYLCYRNSKKRNQKFWTPSAQKMVWSLFSVLSVGGAFCLLLVYHGYFKLVAASMLLFYGLALLNASKYSMQNISALAYTQMSLGLLATFFHNYGLLLWTLGFGVVHIIYGVAMYFKYDRKA